MTGTMNIYNISTKMSRHDNCNVLVSYIGNFVMTNSEGNHETARCVGSLFYRENNFIRPNPRDQIFSSLYLGLVKSSFHCK